MSARPEWDAAQHEAARRELLQATPEEWAALEGHALGRVLDEDPPTEPDWNRQQLAHSRMPPVLPVAPPDRALHALGPEGLGLDAYESTPPPDALPFPSLDTLVLSRDALDALLRRSSIQ